MTLLVFGSGCAFTSSTIAMVRGRATEDMECPRDEVSAYRARGGTYVARGCGKWVEYDCVAPEADGVMCVPHTRAQVQEDPTPK